MINPTSQSLAQQNQLLLLQNQQDILKLTSQYIGELKTQPLNMESVQLLTNLAMASNLSDNYIDYQA